MKLSTISKNVLTDLALLLATSAFAANKATKGSFEISGPLRVSGHELKPEQYKVTWEGTVETFKQCFFHTVRLWRQYPLI